MSGAPERMTNYFQIVSREIRAFIGDFAESGRALHVMIERRLKRLYEQIEHWLNPEKIVGPHIPDDLPDTPYEMARGQIVFGLSIVGVAAFAFIIWGSFAQLSSAAIAAGVVTVDSNRKSVQHLEGGIIKDILVTEGSRVKKGQVLVRLDDTRTSAGVDLVRGQYRSALARVASLTAELQDQDAPHYTAELMDHQDDPEVREILEGQNNLFSSRKASLQGQIDVLNQQVKQFEEETNGLDAQKNAQTEQLALIKEEIVGVRELYNKGLARKPRLLALRRTKSDIEGRIGQFQAQIARIKQSVLKNQLASKDLVNRSKADSAEQLRLAESRVADLGEKLRASANQQERTDIVAPRSGIVVNLKVHTIGGVIQPGATVLEIVPLDDTLIVEARINPRDIDEVHAGMKAQVILTAYNTRRTPYLQAIVNQVSADILRDDVTGISYYKARIEVDLSNLEDFPDITLYPGMPVEVMVATGKRTPFQYLTAPMKSMLRRGARES